MILWKKELDGRKASKITNLSVSEQAGAMKAQPTAYRHIINAGKSCRAAIATKPLSSEQAEGTTGGTSD